MMPGPPARAGFVGRERIEPLVNGVAIARACFELEVEGEVLTHPLVGGCLRHGAATGSAASSQPSW
jgi:hypothetical protein